VLNPSLVVNAFQTSPIGAGTVTSITKAFSPSRPFVALSATAALRAFSAPSARPGAATPQAAISKTVKTSRIFIEFIETLLI
jgi:hypothetical protein